MSPARFLAAVSFAGENGVLKGLIEARIARLDRGALVARFADGPAEAKPKELKKQATGCGVLAAFGQLPSSF